MTADSLHARLANYRQFVARVDDLCGGIIGRFGPEITCSAGCDGCCRHLSLFPVEAAALAESLLEIPPVERERIRERARAVRHDSPCPLLAGHRCLLYDARPLICRTHGLPLLMVRDGRREVDHCPLNFRGVSSLPGTAVIDLDRFNEILVAVNLRFVASYGGVSPWPERLTIAEALLIELPSPLFLPSGTDLRRRIG